MLVIRVAGTAVCVALYGCALVAAMPLLVIARGVLALRHAPSAARGAARVLVLCACFLVLFELPALLCTGAGVLPVARSRELLARLSRRMILAGFPVAGLRLIRTSPEPPATAGQAIVLARHAGAFNTILVLHLIATGLGRHPVTIAKRVAAPTPGLRRLLVGGGVRFVTLNRSGRLRALHHLKYFARQCGAAEAMLLFPEGANFTPGRRARTIARLRADGEDRQAEQAARLCHVLAPHSAGAWYLSSHAPAADVLILAHTGLENPLGRRGWTSGLAARDGAVRVAWRHVPASEVPQHKPAFQAWLTGQWSGIDAWIGGPPAAPESAAPEPAVLEPSGALIPSTERKQ